MLKISRNIIDQINSAVSPADLYEFLQSAIELEHATIPPYLTALYSIKNDPTPDKVISNIFRDIAIEEMLHLTIAANILIALGGKPVINNKDFVPKYPGQLPMIKDSVIVGLKKFSVDLVKNVFMKIEQPEHPLELPVTTIAFEVAVFQYATIGEFYRAIQAKIMELPPDSFINEDLQVTSDYYDDALLFKIKNADDAVKAINIIIEQGEGTDKTPESFEAAGTTDIAHYYRFQQIEKGKLLSKDPVTGAYSFNTDVAIASIEVYPLWDNTKAKDLEGFPAASKALKDFNTCYTRLLADLDDAFNGHPDSIDKAIDSMIALKKLARKLMAMPFPDKEGYTIGPSFEYTL